MIPITLLLRLASRPLWPQSLGVPAAPTPSEAARTLAKVAPEEHRRRVIAKAIQMRKELGMAPASVKL